MSAFHWTLREPKRQRRLRFKTFRQLLKRYMHISLSVRTFLFIVICLWLCYKQFLPSGQAEKHHGGMCLLVAQTMAIELWVGGGPHRFFNTLTFSLKWPRVCRLLPLPMLFFVIWERVFPNYYISFPAAVVVILPVKLALPKLRRICRRRRPDKISFLCVFLFWSCRWIWQQRQRW